MLRDGAAAPQPGWLPFVLIGTFIRGAIGTKTRSEEELGNGQFQVADRALAEHGLDGAGEQVLIALKGTGEVSATAGATAVTNGFQKAERLSIPITLAILVLAFGALVAAGLPLLLGLTAVAIGLLGPVSRPWLPPHPEVS